MTAWKGISMAAVNIKSCLLYTSFKLSVTVQNNTGKAVKGLQVKLDGLATEGITVNGGLDTQTIQNLASGASTTLTYNMACLLYTSSLLTTRS